MEYPNIYIYIDLFFGTPHIPNYGYGFRTPYRFRTQSSERVTDGIRMKFQNWVRNTVRVRKNFEIKVRIRNGYGLILSNVVRVWLRVRIGLSKVYGNWNRFDKMWKFKIYTTLVLLSIYSNAKA